MNEHGKTLYDYCRFMNNMKMRIGLEWLSDVKVESENSGFLVYFFPRGSKRLSLLVKAFWSPEGKQ